MRQPRWRSVRRKTLANQVMRLEAWQVTPSSVKTPQWALDRAIKGLMGFWLKRKDGRRLAKFDQACGGYPIILRVPYRRCDVCNRPLLGEEATERLLMLETTVGGREVPCSERCLTERDMGLWTTLQEVKAAA